MILVLIVLAVLSLLGVAALSLAQQDAATVNRRVNYETLVACADAAQKKLWADFAQFSNSTKASPVVTVPGSQMLLAIGHEGSEDAGAGTPPLVSVAFDANSVQLLPSQVMSGGISENNQSNTIALSLKGQPYLVVAHCTDLVRNATYEVELLVRFGL